MRYSIMLQLASLITLMLVAASAMFAWLQSRPSPFEGELTERELIEREITEQEQTTAFERLLPK